MKDQVKKYMSTIGSKGGKKGKRTDMGAGSEGQRKAQEGRAKAKEAKRIADLEQKKVYD